MPKYDGANCYNQRLTNYEEMYCQYRSQGQSRIDSYKKAYYNVDCTLLNHNTIEQRTKRIEKKDKVIQRLAELKKIKEFEENEINKNTLIKNENVGVGADNQTPRTPYEIFKNNPKDFVIFETYQFLLDCKLSDDRANRLKAIETLAKLFNLYGENQNITNNQLNQIIINSKDINSAVDAIHQLVNKQS